MGRQQITLKVMRFRISNSAAALIGQILSGLLQCVEVCPAAGSRGRSFFGFGRSGVFLRLSGLPADAKVNAANQNVNAAQGEVDRYRQMAE